MATEETQQKRVRVAVVTCYFLPDYVRSISLRAALESLSVVETIVIKNSARGILRYPEVIGKMIWCRLFERPDIYILGFRGQEMLPASLLICHGKPLIFDEFIVPLAWATRENHAKTLRVRWFRFLSKLSAPLYKRWLKACHLVLTDTSAHAELSATLSKTPIDHYRVIPVGTDERLFKPIGQLSAGAQTRKNQFTVFFYGLKMSPLHGLDVIIQAATALRTTHPEVHFQIVSGDPNSEAGIIDAAKRGAKISYQSFVPFAELADMMRASDLCLGGPFGDTEQARSVVTGKTYQSLACGMPTVVANTTAYSAFTNNINCLMVPLGNAHALAAKISWAADNREKLVAIGQSGRKLYMDTFSTSQIAAELQAIITDIV